MYIDKLKWMVEKAEGFVMIYCTSVNHFKIRLPNMLTQENIISDTWETIYYPLLLQRTIEGTNREEGYLIYQEYSEIRIEHNTDPEVDVYISFYDYQSIDQTKQAAIDYIYEMEGK